MVATLNFDPTTKTKNTSDRNLKKLLSSKFHQNRSTRFRDTDFFPSFPYNGHTVRRSLLLRQGHEKRFITQYLSTMKWLSFFKNTVYIELNKQHKKKISI